jgi:predicted SAM-dependent methyltransferase
MGENMPEDCLRLQIGCGRRHLEGWTNIDLNPEMSPDLQVDVTQGLPFPDESVRLIYSEDFLEHLTLEDGLGFLSECHRVLTKDGWMRVLTPDLDVVCSHYFDRNPLTMLWYRKHFGTRTASEMVNEAMRMGGHLFLYDEETLSLYLREKSFGVRPTEFNESSQSELAGLDLRGDGFSIYLDCWKLPAGEIELPAWNAGAVERLWRPWEDLAGVGTRDETFAATSSGEDPQLLGPVISAPREHDLWCVIELSVQANVATDVVQLFWRDDAEAFDVSRMVELPVTCDGEVRALGLHIPRDPKSAIAQLRIDPMNCEGEVEIRSISLCETAPDA